MMTTLRDTLLQEYQENIRLRKEARYQALKVEILEDLRQVGFSSLNAESYRILKDFLDDSGLYIKEVNGIYAISLERYER